MLHTDNVEPQMHPNLQPDVAVIVLLVAEILNSLLTLAKRSSTAAKAAFLGEGSHRTARGAEQALCRYNTLIVNMGTPTSSRILTVSAAAPENTEASEAS